MNIHKWSDVKKKRKFEPLHVDCPKCNHNHLSSMPEDIKAANYNPKICVKCGFSLIADSATENK